MRYPSTHRVSEGLSGLRVNPLYLIEFMMPEQLRAPVLELNVESSVANVPIALLCYASLPSIVQLPVKLPYPHQHAKLHFLRPHEPSLEAPPLRAPSLKTPLSSSSSASSNLCSAPWSPSRSSTKASRACSRRL